MATVSRGRLLVEALKQMVFPGYRSDYFWGWPSPMLLDDRNYQSVGDGSSNSIVAASVHGISRTFPEPPPSLWSLNDHALRPRTTPPAPPPPIPRLPRH